MGALPFLISKQYRKDSFHIYPQTGFWAMCLVVPTCTFYILYIPKSADKPS